jgi:hypothetical protein
MTPELAGCHELTPPPFAWRATSRFWAIYLLTTTAEPYFPKFGFERIQRADVPPTVQTSTELHLRVPVDCDGHAQIAVERRSVMPTRIFINGFGRMGRLALRAGRGRPDLQFVHINEDDRCAYEYSCARSDLVTSGRPSDKRHRV